MSAPPPPAGPAPADRPVVALTELVRHPEFRAGLRETAQVAPGLAAWGLMIGVAMVRSGMSLVEVLLMGIFVFAGSSQLAAIPLIAAGAPMGVILATSFCVNLRFVVFSVHLRDYVMHLPLMRRLLAGYLMVDLNYVFVIRRFPQPAALDDVAGRAAQDAYWLSTGGMCWVTWVASSMVGVALGNTVPESWGLGFAGTLSLLAILCSLLGPRIRSVAAAVAGVAAVASYALPLKLNIVVAIAAAVVIGLLLTRAGPATPPAGHAP